MVHRMITFPITLIWALLVTSSFAADSPNGSPSSQLPGEGSFVIVKGGERVGTLLTSLTPDGDGWLLTAEGEVRMTVLGFRRDAASREEYRLAPDLTIRSFSISQHLSGERFRLTGRRSGDRYQITTTRNGRQRQDLLEPVSHLFPAPLLNTVAHRRAQSGRTTVLSFLDPESGEVKRVTFTFVGEETVGGRKLFRYRNDLYPVVDNHVWVDDQGRTVRESVRRGLIETVPASPAQVREVRERLRHPIP